MCIAQTPLNFRFWDNYICLFSPKYQRFGLGKKPTQVGRKSLRFQYFSFPCLSLRLIPILYLVVHGLTNFANLSVLLIATYGSQSILAPVVEIISCEI
jgi:hypothetical protein